MEVIVFIALLAVVAVKGFTNHSIQALESKIRAAQAEEAEISERLQTTESSLRALEKEHKVLEQEVKHLENDKDLATLEVAKAGGKPLTEEQLDQLINATTTKTAPKPTPPKDETTTSEEEAQPTDEAPTNTNNTDTEQAPSNPSSNPPTNAQKPRILVVDDNDELRGLLLQALSKEYDVLEAPDGFEALSQILKQNEKYDLIITDLNMPKVNGIQLVEHLPNAIPTIIISAFLNKPEFKKALAELQPASILEKPFQIATLRSAIQDALASQKSKSTQD